MPITFFVQVKKSFIFWPMTADIRWYSIGNLFAVETYKFIPFQFIMPIVCRVFFLYSFFQSCSSSFKRTTDIYLLYKNYEKIDINDILLKF